MQWGVKNVWALLQNDLAMPLWYVICKSHKGIYKTTPKARSVPDEQFSRAAP